MLKLFSAFVETPKRSSFDDSIGQKFTRFAPRHSRHAAPEALASRQDIQPEERLPVAALRPITRAATAFEPKFNDTAHLYAETRVSVSVLRRALPERFANMN